MSAPKKYTFAAVKSAFMSVLSLTPTEVTGNDKLKATYAKLRENVKQALFKMETAIKAAEKKEKQQMKTFDKTSAKELQKYINAKLKGGERITIVDGYMEEDEKSEPEQEPKPETTPSIPNDGVIDEDLFGDLFPGMVKEKPEDEEVLIDGADEDEKEESAELSNRDALDDVPANDTSGESSPEDVPDDVYVEGPGMLGYGKKSSKKNEIRSRLMAIMNI